MLDSDLIQKLLAIKFLKISKISNNLGIRSKSSQWHSTNNSAHAWAYASRHFCVNPYKNLEPQFHDHKLSFSLIWVNGG